MSLNDKRNLLSSLDGQGPIILELGCGPLKRYARSIGIDIADGEAVDIVGDACEALHAFPAESVDLVTSCHFLEHIPDVSLLLHEMARVVRVGGSIEVIVPHFAHPYFSSDPTHIHRFGLYTFSYYAEDRILRRSVPFYVREPDLRLRDVKLIFKSARPFYGRHAIKRLLGFVFNLSRYLQELYEENLCYIFPCYEIRFILEKVERG
jgi:ubiquinone/menaquinone biosynthesis C-methylase UbiE